MSAGALVFTASAAVLILEIVAARVLAPFVGVTLETYTAIIGVVLAGIALGASWGGRLADRIDPRRLLGPLIIAGGALALLTVPLVLFLGPPLQGGGAGAVIVLAAVGFFPPALALSAVPPAVVKLRLRDLDETGAVVGRLSAVSTAGAIVGTFVTGFVLVATIPTRAIILTVGLALIIGGVALHWRLGRRSHEPSPTDVRLYAAAGLIGAVMTGVVQAPCDMESAYYCAEVVQDPDNASQRTLVLDSLQHSAVDLDDPRTLQFEYTQWLAAAMDTKWSDGQALRALHIGGGGFTIPRYLQATRPGTFSHVMEIDPALVALNRERLGLVTGPDLQVDVGDARIGITQAPSDSFDLVVGDAFGGLAVPWHLTTREFTQDVRRTLKPDGMYVINLIDGPPFRFARGELATLRDVFTSIAVVSTSPRLSGRQGGNVVLLASDAPLRLGTLSHALKGRGVVVLSGPALDKWIGSADVLTDDHAPVDQLMGYRS